MADLKIISPIAIKMDILASLILLWGLCLINAATLFHFVNSLVIPDMSEETLGLSVYFVVQQVNECGGSLNESVFINKTLKNKKVSMVFVFLCISPTLVF